MKTLEYTLTVMIVFLTIRYLIRVIIALRKELKVELYKARVQQELLALKDQNYQVYSHHKGRFFYEDQNVLSVITGLNDYYELHPERKGEEISFQDDDQKSHHIIFTGPFHKFK